MKLGILGNGSSLGVESTWMSCRSLIPAAREEEDEEATNGKGGAAAVDVNPSGSRLIFFRKAWAKDRRGDAVAVDGVATDPATPPPKEGGSKPGDQAAAAALRPRGAGA